MELKLISVRDTGAEFRIEGRGSFRSPVARLLLSTEQIRKLINLHRGPKNIYFVDPEGIQKPVRVTGENYHLSTNEIFKKTVLEDKEEKSEITGEIAVDEIAEPEVFEELPVDDDNSAELVSIEGIAENVIVENAVNKEIVIEDSEDSSVDVVVEEPVDMGGNEPDGIAEHTVNTNNQNGNRHNNNGGNYYKNRYRNNNYKNNGNRNGGHNN